MKMFIVVRALKYQVKKINSGFHYVKIILHHIESIVNMFLNTD